jgi:hypothetical protein
MYIESANLPVEQYDFGLFKCCEELFQQILSTPLLNAIVHEAFLLNLFRCRHLQHGMPLKLHEIMERFFQDAFVVTVSAPLL